MVAQKPAGSFSPLLSSGHAWLAGCAEGFDGLCAGAVKVAAQSTPNAAARNLANLEARMNCMESPPKTHIDKMAGHRIEMHNTELQCGFDLWPMETTNQDTFHQDVSIHGLHHIAQRSVWTES